MKMLPDCGTLPDRWDKRRVYHYREYCIRCGDDDNGYYESTLAEAKAAVARHAAEGVIATVCAENAKAWWVPAHYGDEGEWVPGEWEHETIGGENIDFGG